MLPSHWVLQVLPAWHSAHSASGLGKALLGWALDAPGPQAEVK